MSNPVNPLDKYRSYSYQHFLLVANNTESLRALQTNQLSFASLSALKHGQSMQANGSQVVMVINSEIDSLFFIESLSYQANYLGMSAGKHLSMATDIVITVRDTGGIAFLIFVRDLVDNTLSTSANGLIFMLKTFFVGHTDTGSVEVMQIDPITLIFSEIESSFDATGGVHLIKAAGGGAGAPLADESLLYINRNLNLVTNTNSILLKDMVQNLQDKINQQLQAQFQSVSKATNGNGRQVKYLITIPDEWSTYTLKSLTKDNYVEKLFPKEQQAVQQTSQPVPNSQAKQQNDGDRFKTQVNTNTKVTIIQVLAEIFKHCDDIHSQLVDNAQPNKSGELPKLYQILTSITSDAKSVTVHIDVVNYYLPKVNTKSSGTNNSQSSNSQVVVNQTKTTQNDGSTAPQARHQTEQQYGIVFDYIFTGKNTDILNFDIKANLTNLFMQQNRPGSNIALNSDPKTASADPTQAKQTNKQTAPIVEIRKFDPIYLPTLTSEAQRGYMYASPEAAKLRDSWIKYVARMVAATTTGGHISIRGNPAFLNQQIPEIMPHDDTAYKSKLADNQKAAAEKAKTMTGTFDSTKQTSYAGDKSEYIPLLIKINVYTPDPNNPGKYMPYFYQGYYSVSVSENKFVAGEFIQDLTIHAYDMDDLDDPQGYGF